MRRVLPLASSLGVFTAQHVLAEPTTVHHSTGKPSALLSTLVSEFTRAVSPHIAPFSPDQVTSTSRFLSSIQAYSSPATSGELTIVVDDSPASVRVFLDGQQVGYSSDRLVIAVLVELFSESH